MRLLGIEVKIDIMKPAHETWFELCGELRMFGWCMFPTRYSASLAYDADGGGWVQDSHTSSQQHALLIHQYGLAVGTVVGIIEPIDCEIKWGSFDCEWYDTNSSTFHSHPKIIRITKRRVTLPYFTECCTPP